MTRQTIYTSACDCQKPLPLIKTNYLSEFRTEVEKAKARENLGIADDITLMWKNLKGHIEDNDDLKEYIKLQQEFEFSSDFVSNIHTILDGLKYILEYITFLESLGTTVTKLKEDCLNLKIALENVESLLESEIKDNSDNIDDIKSEIENINKTISDINEALQAIDIEASSLEWIKSALRESKTVSLIEDEELSTIEVKISEQEGNAVLTLDDGVFVPDVQPLLNEIKEKQEKIDETLGKYEESISYITDLPDDTSSPTVDGLKVKDIKDKSLSQIVDTLFFPPTVRELVLPVVFYSVIPTLVEVGTPFAEPQVIYNAGDAGESTFENTILFNGQETEDTSYSKLGTYTHKCVVNYEDGEKLLNNRGEITNKYIHADSIDTEINVVTTYPWYAGNTLNAAPQPLVPFGIVTNELEVSLSGKAVIKLPGRNSSLNSFTLDSGMGFLAVNMEDWETSTTELNGITYTVFTKIHLYSSVINHKIKFKLTL